MMRNVWPLLLLSPFSILPASAGILTLDFNSLQVGEEVLGYYNGGFGSLGDGPGPMDGVTFTSDFVTVPGGYSGRRAWRRN